MFALLVYVLVASTGSSSAVSVCASPLGSVVSTTAQSESLRLRVGSEPAQAVPESFADRNEDVVSDQLTAHGCACAADGTSANTPAALATLAKQARPVLMRIAPLSSHGPLMSHVGTISPYSLA